MFWLVSFFPSPPCRSWMAFFGGNGLNQISGKCLKLLLMDPCGCLLTKISCWGKDLPHRKKVTPVPLKKVQALPQCLRELFYGYFSPILHNFSDSWKMSERPKLCRVFFPRLRQMNNEKNPGCLGHRRDFTTQLYRDCNKPL